ncbi:MAG TPA: Xaa-Pro peptidase family protein [Fimbriimonas sp.]
MALTAEKLRQALPLVQRAGVDAWITFVRETSAAGDPVLPLLLNGGLTWQSALIVFSDGRTVAIVGNYDADPLAASGDWSEVVPYVQGIREPLQAALRGATTVAVNYSRNDVMADGLTHGMFLTLQELLPGIELRSAEEIVSELRSVKTPEEAERIRQAIRTTQGIFEEIPRVVRRGMSERDLYDHIQARIEERRLGYAWDKAGNPIVNFGPHSMVGHGVPSPEIRLEEGQILHIDLGVVECDYSSDLQRCWFVGDSIPDEVLQAFACVNSALSAGAQALRPGARGVDVDAAARGSFVANGYEEYLHALGHQVGRLAHDGGGILGPAWERYGNTPFLPVKENQVYTLELGAMVPGRGYLGLEEMVRVRTNGVEWLSDRQLSLPTLSLAR